VWATPKKVKSLKAVLVICPPSLPPLHARSPLRERERDRERERERERDLLAVRIDG
jgi:hypothetical protein